MTTAAANPKSRAGDDSVSLPLVETIRPEEVDGVAEALRAAHHARQPVYPLGGRTSLDFGLTPTQPGQGLDLTGVNRAVDYTPRDMTIVVEAGMTVSQLWQVLAAENQWLPIDVPRAEEATVGGAVATNWNGSRRYGHGTWRDYLIGISAIDGRGTAFKAGGRVVKNVAGYDFCKLLTGSLGTLGVITQLVLKVKPRPEVEATLVAPCLELQTADRALEALSRTAARPSAIDLLVGKGWNSTGMLPESNCDSWFVVGLEGTAAEVDWMADEMLGLLNAAGISETSRLDESRTSELRRATTEFSDRGAGTEPDEFPLAIKVVVPPSATVDIVKMVLAIDSNCTIQCHAGNGVIVARFAEFTASDLTQQLVGKLRPAAIQRGGSLVVLSSSLGGLTAPIVWGGRTRAHELLAKVKGAFDPHEILNPGRMF